MFAERRKLKEFADGWIGDRDDAAVPGLVKLAYATIAVGCVVYFLMYMNGAVEPAGPSLIVRALNAATETSGGLMFAIAALMVVYGVIVVAFSFGKPND